MSVGGIEGRSAVVVPGSAAATARPAARRSSSSSRRRTSPALLGAIVATSAVLAALADAAPTSHGVADALWRAAAGAIVPLLAADARRWSWFPLAGVAVAVGRGLFGFAAGVAALALTFAAGFSIGRRRWIGAAVGALSVQALLRGITYGPLGTPTAVAIAAVVPVAVSTLRHASPRLRRSLIGGAVVAVVVVGILSVFTAVSAYSARDRITRALDLSDEALAAAEDGDAVLAGSLIGAAGEELDAIADDFSAPWLAPARFVPVLGQHAGALRDLSAAGGAVAASASEVLVGVDPDILLPGPGSIDVDAVRALVGPMNDLRRELGAAIVTIQDIDDTWVLPLAADRIDEVGEELTARFDTVTGADDIMASLPGLLGGDGTRRYLVVFMTPAEARAAGGFAGNWAEIVAADGRIAVVDSGRGDVLTNGVGPTGVRLPDDIDVSLHDGFRLTEVFQNVTAIVDFPSMARAAAAWYTQATGTAVDGVIGVDPDAMAGLVRLSGPVTIDDRTFDAGGLRDFVLRGQYVDFEDDEEGREEILEALTFGVFETLVTSEPPTPVALVDVMGPLVERDSIRMISLDDTENAALRSIGLTDDFPLPAGQDLLAVVTQNLGENKIDSFLERDIAYDATVDPATGDVTARLTVTLTNTAPADGLPGAIIGNNDLDFRPGTNRTRLQIYTPLQLVRATVAGDTVPMVPETELGWNRFRRDLFVDAGSSITLTVDLAGTVDVADGYVLEVDHQPLANPDRIQLAITPSEDWAIATNSGIDGTGRGTLSGDRDQVMGLTFSRTGGP